MTQKCGSCEVEHQINELWYAFREDHVINLDVFLKETDGNFEVDLTQVYCFVCLGSHFPDIDVNQASLPLKELPPTPIKPLSEISIEPPKVATPMHIGAKQSELLKDILDTSQQDQSNGTLSSSTLMNATMKLMMQMQEQLDSLKSSQNKENERPQTSAPRAPIFTSSTGITKEMATNSGESWDSLLNDSTSPSNTAALETAELTGNIYIKGPGESYYTKKIPRTDNFPNKLNLTLILEGRKQIDFSGNLHLLQHPKIHQAAMNLKKAILETFPHDETWSSGNLKKRPQNSGSSWGYNSYSKRSRPSMYNN